MNADDEKKLREAFEKWVSSPPFEYSTERHNHPSGYCYIHIEVAERLTAAPSGHAMTKVATDGFNGNSDKRLVWESSTFRSFRGW